MGPKSYIATVSLTEPSTELGVKESLNLNLIALLWIEFI